MKTRVVFPFFVTILLLSACQTQRKQNDPSIFDKSNLVAWCVVPFDSVGRTPEQRATMLANLGFTQFAYDWRAKHLPTFGDEVAALNKHHIKMKSVWMWVTPDSSKIIDDTSEEMLRLIEENNVNTDLWLCFQGDYFDGLADGEKVDKAVRAINYLHPRTQAWGGTINLYNHGDWFGEPENQIKIIQAAGYDDVGIIYNFHHGHKQEDRFTELLPKMLPYLNTININGMDPNGPQILTLGSGTKETEMLRVIKDSGYTGPIGILGHVEDADVEVILRNNLDGLAKIASQLER